MAKNHDRSKRARVEERETMTAVPGVPYLYLRTHKSGKQTYTFRRRFNGRAYKIALGEIKPRRCQTGG
jgi:hypothetical protein